MSDQNNGRLGLLRDDLRQRADSDTFNPFELAQEIDNQKEPKFFYYPHDKSPPNDHQ